jgi:hypothetical protein
MLRYIVCGATLALTGCASVSTQIVAINPAQHYPPTQNVEVLLQKPPRPHFDIALIEAHGEVGVSEAELLNDAREKAKALGADAIVKTDLERIYVKAVPVYDPWYDPLFFGYYRYRPFPPYPSPWTPYRLNADGYVYTLKAVAIKYRDAGAINAAART